MKDRVTLEATQEGVSEDAVKDYGRRCEAIGRERRNTADLQDAMDHPEFKKRHHDLLDQLAAEQQLRKPIMERRPFATIKLGTHKSVKDLRKALLDAGYRIGDWGDDILKRINVASKPEDVDIVVVSVAELGFPNGATRAQIYEKALSMGLGLCPAEVGPQWRLQYADQPMGEWILVGMEPISDSGGSLKVFDVVRFEDGRWLYGNDGRPGGVWYGDLRWAFRRK
jgi:hypothetical protein